MPDSKSLPGGEGTNTGHGHVFPRPDGVKARCGGPGLCDDCGRDLARKEAGHGGIPTGPVAHDPDAERHVAALDGPHFGVTGAEPPKPVNVGPGGVLDLDNVFTYHPPHGDQVERYGVIRAEGKNLAEVIAACVPPGPERSTAIAKVREAVMWANAGIACREKGPDE